MQPDTAEDFVMRPPRKGPLMDSQIACQHTQKVLRSTWIDIHSSRMLRKDPQEIDKSGRARSDHYCICVTCFDKAKRGSSFSQVKAEQLSNMRPEVLDKLLKAIPLGTAMRRSDIRLRMNHDRDVHSFDGSLPAYIVDELLDKNKSVAANLYGHYVISDQYNDIFAALLGKNYSDTTPARSWPNFDMADVFALTLADQDGKVILFRETYAQGQDKKRPLGATYRCSELTEHWNPCCFRFKLQRLEAAGQVTYSFSAMCRWHTCKTGKPQLEPIDIPSDGEDDTEPARTTDTQSAAVPSRPAKHERQSEDLADWPAAKRQMQIPTPPPSARATTSAAPFVGDGTFADNGTMVKQEEGARLTAARKGKQRAISQSPPRYNVKIPMLSAKLQSGRREIQAGAGAATAAASTSKTPLITGNLSEEALAFLKLAGIGYQEDLKASGLLKGDISRFLALVKEFCSKNGGQIVTESRARRFGQIIVDVVKMGRVYVD